MSFDKKQQKEVLLTKMFEKTKEIPLGTEICTSELMKIVSSESSYKDGKYIYDDAILDMKDMFDLDHKYKTQAKKHGIIIDNSIHDGEVLGMPFHIGFLVKEIK